MQTGYFRYPTLAGQQLIFISEDDLWQVSLDQPTARRLTAGRGASTFPSLSPDGRHVAYTSKEEGGAEIYVMPAEGGESKRLTYWGMESNTQVVAWKDSESLYVISNARTSQRSTELYEVSLRGGNPLPLSLGPVTNLANHPTKKWSVIERNSHRPDPAHWKRYRGGTAGRLWIADKFAGEYKVFLKELGGNLASPCWVGDRLYFLSDHERVAQVYSCQRDGSDVKRHSHQEHFYARNLKTDGKSLVFHAGADLFHFNPQSMKEPQKVSINYHSPRVERQRKFVPASKYLEDFSLDDKGENWAVAIRGQVHSFSSFEGPVLRHGQKDSVRYKLPVWGMDSKHLFLVSDEGGEDRIEVYTRRATEFHLATEGLDLGRITDLQPNPKNDHQVAVTNHRGELLLVDLSANNYSLINKNEHRTSARFDWSPDGLWLAYTKAETPSSWSIQIYSLLENSSYEAVPPGYKSYSPRFDRTKNYLYYLTEQELDPVYDSVQFELSFQNTCLIGVVSLEEGLDSPFSLSALKATNPEPEGGIEKKESGDAKNGAAELPVSKGLKIDLEGLSARAVAFPIPAGKYAQVTGVNGKIYYLSSPVEGSLRRNIFAQNDDPKSSLMTFDPIKKAPEVVFAKVSDYGLTNSGKHFVLRVGKKLRQWPVMKKPTGKEPAEAGPESGFIDADRMKVLIEPPKEWRQMLAEIWRLQRDHYWIETMSNINWNGVRAIYEPLVDRVSTRREFGDLVWELQGELGTSHAYDIGGDLKREPSYRIGMLGAEFVFDKKASGYRIKKLYHGPGAKIEQRSPLALPGIQLSEGDLLLSVNGQKISESRSIDQQLLNLAGQEVELEFRRKGSELTESKTVKTLISEGSLRYLDWVERNRKTVHEKTLGRVGYIHIPDMGPNGFAEFHRSFLQEYDRDALIVDVRYNGGGHVSQLLLEKLARKRTAFNVSRWYGSSPYPSHSPAGPLVAITNEFAGSDGDIFSHNFKLWGLGPLIGTRTWGGVIGISPRHFLADGGITTQPEYSYWFKDVGFDVENYGTEPDIEVDIAPQDWLSGRDPQMEKALELIEQRMKEVPAVRPELNRYPDLSR